MKKLGFIALMLLAGLWACEYETIQPVYVEPPDFVEFAVDIAPIFVDAGCASCHAGSTDPDLRADKSWDALVNGGYVDTANPGDSELIEKIESGHGTSGNINAEQKAKILKWIEDGAKND